VAEQLAASQEGLSSMSDDDEQLFNPQIKDGRVEHVAPMMEMKNTYK
jgi:hypothetical protein